MLNETFSVIFKHCAQVVKDRKQNFEFRPNFFEVLSILIKSFQSNFGYAWKKFDTEFCFKNAEFQFNSSSKTKRPKTEFRISAEFFWGISILIKISFQLNFGYAQMKFEYRILFQKCRISVLTEFQFRLI